MKRFFLSGIISFLLCVVSANPDSIQPVTDSLISKTILTETQLPAVEIKDIDSLLNLWHIEKNLKETNRQTTVYYDKESSLHPETIKVRLAEIESPIHFSYNDIVKKYIDIYAGRYKKYTAKMIGLSEYYFPIFEPILHTKGIPLEIKYLPIIESAFKPHATSPAGAAGLWQFMYGTGKSYGLNITSYVDERRDPVKSTKAAAEYMKDLYDIYGDWILVIAAYNCGPGNVNKAIRRAGGKRNYWDIYYFLPKETRNYVPAYIAVTYSFIYHKDHNIISFVNNFPPATDTISVQQPVHFEQITDVLGIKKEHLQILNPHYTGNIIPKGGGKYSLILPTEYVGKFIDLENSIYNANREKYFSTENNILTKPNEKFAVYASSFSIEGKTKINYTVKEGDVIGLIADWFDVRVTDLKRWNKIRRNIIRVDQKLRIYVPSEKANYYRNLDVMNHSQKQTVSKGTSNTPVNVLPPYEPNKFEYYTVRRGDNLWTIAKKYEGISNKDIIQLNNITDHRKLKIGQKLRIKPKT